MNDEKWQWVLEQCGLKYRAIEHKDRVYEGCLTDAQCNPLPYGYPPHDLNNIFKHVMPRLHKFGLLEVSFHREIAMFGNNGELLPEEEITYRWRLLLEVHIFEPIDGRGKDPADALLGACYKALGGKE